MAATKTKSSKISKKMQSFVLIKTSKPFMTFQITEQTIYWIVLLSLIAILFMWVLNIQIDTLRAVNNM